MSTRSRGVLFGAAVLCLCGSLAQGSPAASSDAPDSPPAQSGEGGVLLRLRDVDLVRVVELYGRITNKTILPPPDLTGKLTILNPKSVEPKEAARLLESALALQGWGFESAGSALKVIHIAKSSSSPGAVPIPTPTPASVPVPESSPVPTPVPTPAVAITKPVESAEPQENEQAEQQAKERERARKRRKEASWDLDHVMDQEPEHEASRKSSHRSKHAHRGEIATEAIQVHEVDPTTIVELLDDAMGDGPMTFVADERQQSVIVSGPTREFAPVRRMIELLDRSSRVQRPDADVVHLRFARAATVVDLLSRTYREQVANIPGTSIGADPVSNSIIISGPPEIRTQLAQVVSHLDIHDPRVFMRLWIAEVDPGSLDGLGFQWSETPHMASPQPGAAATGTPPDAGLRSSLLPPLFRDDPLGTLRGTNADFLAAPKLMVNVNEEATYRMAVPGRRKGATPPEPEAAREEASVELHMTPHLNQSNEVALDMRVDLADYPYRRRNDADRQSRVQTITTHVSVPNGQDLAIGGLTCADLSERPHHGFWAHFPLFGRLFRGRDSGPPLRELLMVITPWILDGTALPVAPTMVSQPAPAPGPAAPAAPATSTESPAPPPPASPPLAATPAAPSTSAASAPAAPTPPAASSNPAIAAAKEFAPLAAPAVPVSAVIAKDESSNFSAPGPLPPPVASRPPESQPDPASSPAATSPATAPSPAPATESAVTQATVVTPSPIAAVPAAPTAPRPPPASVLQAPAVEVLLAAPIVTENAPVAKDVVKVAAPISPSEEIRTLLQKYKARQSQRQAEIHQLHADAPPAR